MAIIGFLMVLLTLYQVAPKFAIKATTVRKVIKYLALQELIAIIENVSWTENLVLQATTVYNLHLVHQLLERFFRH